MYVDSLLGISSSIHCEEHRRGAKKMDAEGRINFQDLFMYIRGFIF